MIGTFSLVLRRQFLENSNLQWISCRSIILIAINMNENKNKNQTIRYDMMKLLIIHFRKQIVEKVFIRKI